MKEQIQELIKKWEEDKATYASIAQKSAARGNEMAYKEFMNWSFGIDACISDLKNLIK